MRIFSNSATPSYTGIKFEPIWKLGLNTISKRERYNTLVASEQIKNR